VVVEGGNLYTFGSGDHGQLGHALLSEKKLRQETYPRSLPNLKNVIQVSCGGFHTLALTQYGHVYAWGAGGYGQIGTGKIGDSLDPHSSDVKANPQALKRPTPLIYSMSNQCRYEQEPVHIPMPAAEEGDDRPVVSVAAGRWHSMALIAGDGVNSR